MTRPLIDFGPAADDYRRHRPGFPDVFFTYVQRYGIGLSGQRVLDIGCGTGTLARGFAQRGCDVVGLDASPEMLAAAHALGRTEHVQVAYVRARAETTGLTGASFDMVCAGQCWHWFNRDQAAVEVRRVLRAGGHVLIAYFTYLSDPGTLGAATEALVLRHNPTWTLAGSDGRPYPFAEDLGCADFTGVDSFWFDVTVEMTHASWRGRLRASNGVLLMAPTTAAAFDADLADLLARTYPEPLQVPHRVFGIVATKP